MPKYHTIYLRVPVDVYAKLEALSKANHRSIPSEIRHALDVGVLGLQANPAPTVDPADKEWEEGDGEL